MGVGYLGAEGFIKEVDLANRNFEKSCRTVPGAFDNPIVVCRIMKGSL